MYVEMMWVSIRALWVINSSWSIWICHAVRQHCGEYTTHPAGTLMVPSIPEMVRSRTWLQGWKVTKSKLNLSPCGGSHTEISTAWYSPQAPLWKLPKVIMVGAYQMEWHFLSSISSPTFFFFSYAAKFFFFLCYAWASTISPWHCALCLLYSAFPGYLCTLVLWQERTIVLLRSRPHKPRLGMTGLNSYPLSKVLYSLRTYLESVGKIMGN